MTFVEWKRCKLGDLYDIMPATNEFYPGHHLHLGPRDITGIYFLPHNNIPSTNIQAKDTHFTSVKRGDIFFAVLHKTNMASVALEDFEVITLNRFVRQIRLKKNIHLEVDPAFLSYYLRSPFVYRQIERSSISTIRFNLTNESIRNLEVRLPPIELQHKIGRMLKSLDDKRENNRLVIKTLNEIIRTTFREWFRYYRIPNICKENKKSELGIIPRDWNVRSLGEITHFQSGYPFRSEDLQKENGNIGVVKIRNIHDNIANVTNTDSVNFQVIRNIDKKYKVQKGSLLIAMSGSEIGKVGLAPSTDKDLWLNQRVGMLSETFPYGNFFLCYLLSTDSYRQIFRQFASGTAQPNISAAAIKNIRVIIPPEKLVSQFGIKLYPLFEKIMTLVNENEKLHVSRSRLLPLLMSGKI